MKAKIVGIFVIMLLIATVLPISAQIKSYEAEKDDYINPINSGWYKTYGGDGVDTFTGLELTSDGNYIITGNTEIDGSLDAWIVKMDVNGEIIWETTYGTPKGEDELWGVTETSDGGYICSGWSYQNESRSWDGLLIKTDANGSILWVQTYGGNGFDEVVDVIETDDGYILLTNYNEKTSVSLLKTDWNGTTLWENRYKKKQFSEWIEVLETNDGFFVVGGYWGSLYPSDGWLLKFDKDGNEEWNKTFGLKIGCGFLTGIDSTSDGGYILVGGTRGGWFGVWGSDVWLMKVDSNGDVLWEKHFGKPYFTDYSLSVQETEDHGFIITGHTLGVGNIFFDLTASWPYWSKICLIKTDANGTVLWEKLMPGNGHGRTVREIDYGYIISGYTGNWKNSEYAVLIKTDKNGNID